jgi:site-specific DNA recombinase
MAGMRAAVFARKSTKDDSRDEELSVVRQEQNARAFADSHGMEVVGVYVDNVSGQASNRLVQRSRLMADAANGAFDAVIVRNADRLSRDDIEVDPVVILAGYGVEVWEYLTAKRLDVGTAKDRFLRSVDRFSSRDYTEKASVNTREKKFDKARIQGEHGIADGRVLGYKTVGPAKQRQRVIDPEEAKLVTRIFEMSASGMGYLRIATALNKDCVKNPSGQDRSNATKRSDQWSASGIKAVLGRDLYRGKLVYGRTRNRWTPDGRKKERGDKLVTVERADLRIVEEPLWRAAHARMAAANKQYLRATGGQLYGKPGAGAEGKHLLSGLLRCAVCGGNMFLNKKTGRRGRPTTYFTCSNHRAGRGLAAGPCTNDRSVPLVELTEGVVAELKKLLLEPMELVKALSAEITRRQAQPEAMRAQREEAQTKVARLKAAVENLSTAIEEGGQIKNLVERLAAREAELRDAQAALEHLDGLEIGTEPLDEVALLEELVTTIKALRDNLDGDPARGRQVVKRLLQTPIDVGPDETGGWSFKFRASFLDAPLDLAAPDGTVPLRPSEREFSGTVRRGEPRWCPRGDSNTRHAV